MKAGYIVDPDLGLIREVRHAGGDSVKKCYQCATCSIVCQLAPQQSPFPRKEMHWAQWGQTEWLVADPDLWLCHQCNDCSVNCPRGARPGDVLAAIRCYIYKSCAFPTFMGKALASPTALPFLFLLPILILLGCVYFSAPTDATGTFLFLTSLPVDYNIFLPHSTVDALFVIGNIIIVIFAAVGFSRFWKGLKAGGRRTKLSFIRALLQTVKEVIVHTHFNRCETNRPRALGHMLLFFGFIGSMITTGLVFVLIFIPHYLHEWQILDIHILPMPPIELPSPIKIIGALSGLALIIGGALLIIRRWTNRDDVGANGYADYLFLYIMFSVGLTGMLSWIMRSYVGIPLLAYINYFIHMVFVYFLLWYMPYSKFAHMIYRTLAMVYARSIDRRPRSTA
ncbi:MAG: quinone-interacting membrane-bound oxidoreductase complex subunit QmoC [Candidatus Zixiibacteriota bacterium]|nr:MAG: quinone-interacting membrane-bound oxidoreductase complex subunit QmoC [candidate division Zixibacteria bacterium]